jgi:putative hydrolase of the HAD superfamily
MKIKSIILDFDNTIYPEKQYFNNIFSHFCELKNIDFNLFENLLTQFDYIRMTEKDIFSFILKKVNHYSIENHNCLFKLYLEITSTLYPYRGIDFFFNKALSKKIEICVLTNGVIEAQKNKWTNLVLENKNKIKFQPSREFGEDKPSDNTFTKMLFLMNRKPEEVLFIGDRFDNDIKWALENNSNGVLFNSNEISHLVPSFNNAIDLWHYITNEFNL